MVLLLPPPQRSLILIGTISISISISISPNSITNKQNPIYQPGLLLERVDLFSSSMASISQLLMLLFIAYSHIRVESHEGGHIKAEISTKGIDFVKDLLIAKAESSLVPLGVSDIEKYVRIPLIGRVHIVLSGITINRIDLSSSAVDTRDSGIIVNVSGATANLNMNWKYRYRARWIPISISDEGTATVEVAGMEISVAVSLKTVKGSLNAALSDCKCYVRDVSIKMDGGASWLYQGLVDAFQRKIGSAVEDAISKKINDIIVKLDSLLHSIPKQVPVTNSAFLNTTFVNDPQLSDSSVEVEMNGLFFAKHELALSSYYLRSLEASASCQEANKMAKIFVHRKVLETASSVIFKEHTRHWIIDKVPDEELLNTSGWKLIIPELYKMYPNRSMNLNISASSPPTFKVEKQQIWAVIPLDVVIDVLGDEETIPVACISTVISSSVTAEIAANVVSGNLKLNNLTMHLEWSRIGDFHVNPLQAFISTMVKTAVLPYINSKLSHGFGIPVIHGYGLRDARIVFEDSWIVICSDVARVKQLSVI